MEQIVYSHHFNLARIQQQQQQQGERAKAKQEKKRTRYKGGQKKTGFYSFDSNNSSIYHSIDLRQ